MSNFERICLDQAEGSKFFNKIPLNEIKFEITSVNSDFEASFPFGIENAKKGAIFEVRLLDLEPGIYAKISGEFSVKMRKGADSVAKGLGKDLDLRLRSIIWNGGYYKGFAAPVLGGDYDRETNNWIDSFPRIENFTIK